MAMEFQVRENKQTNTLNDGEPTKFRPNLKIPIISVKKHIQDFLGHIFLT